MQATVSSGQERRWLVLSYFSNVDGLACSQHLDDRLPFLARAGIEPWLLTSTCGERWPRWRHARVPGVAPSGLRFELREWAARGRGRGPAGPVSAVLRLLLFPFHLLEKALLDLDAQWSWFGPAALRGLLLCRRAKPEVIYSTGGPACAHVAAGLVAGWTGTPWIAEFQDPLVYPGLRRRGPALPIYRWVERFVCRRADVVVFLTDAARVRAAARTGMTARSLTIYPGAEPGTVPPARSSQGGACRFAHFGTLSGSRNLDPFLQALQALCREQPQWRDRVQVDQYGFVDGGALDAAPRLAPAGVLQQHGRVPRREALAAMGRADVLLLVQDAAPVSEETIPSKAYEYLVAGRPVLGLIGDNPELRALLAARGHLAVPTADVAKIQEAIGVLLARWTADPPPAASGPVELTVAAAVGRLVESAGRRRERS